VQSLTFVHLIPPFINTRTVIAQCRKANRTVKHIWFLPIHKANAEKPKEPEILGVEVKELLIERKAQ
jgi:hypothetical protein